MTGRAMQWGRAAKRDRVNAEALREKEIVPIKIDQAFWRSWRSDPKAMRQAGVRVTKIGGRWRAWIERKAG